MLQSGNNNRRCAFMCKNESCPINLDQKHTLQQGSIDSIFHHMEKVNTRLDQGGVKMNGIMLLLKFSIALSIVKIVMELI